MVRFWSKISGFLGEKLGQASTSIAGGRANSRPSAATRNSDAVYWLGLLRMSCKIAAIAISRVTALLLRIAAITFRSGPLGPRFVTTFVAEEQLAG